MNEQDMDEYPEEIIPGSGLIFDNHIDDEPEVDEGIEEILKAAENKFPRRCPFCGSFATTKDVSDWNYRLNSGELFAIGCSKTECIAFIADMDAHYSSEEEAIEEWNKRI